MMITFEGRVERVERVCHVSVSISSHAFTGIPNLYVHTGRWRFVLFTSPSHWDLTNCQTSFVRVSVVIILPTWSRRPDCPDQWEARRKLLDQSERRVGMARSSAAGLRNTTNSVCHPSFQLLLNVVLRRKQLLSQTTCNHVIPISLNYQRRVGFDKIWNWKIS